MARWDEMREDEARRWGSGERDRERDREYTTGGSRWQAGQRPDREEWSGGDWRRSEEWRGRGEDRPWTEGRTMGQEHDWDRGERERGWRGSEHEGYAGSRGGYETDWSRGGYRGSGRFGEEHRGYGSREGGSFGERSYGSRGEYGGGMGGYGAAPSYGGTSGYGSYGTQGTYGREGYSGGQYGGRESRGAWGGGEHHGEDRGFFERVGDKIREGVHRMGRGPKGYKRSDDRIREDVCERIARSGLDADDVEVKVESAEVTLTGTVHDRMTKRRLEDAIEDVFGVDEVHNHLRLRREEDQAATRSGAEEGAGLHH